MFLVFLYWVAIVSCAFVGIGVWLSEWSLVGYGLIWWVLVSVLWVMRQNAFNNVEKTKRVSRDDMNA